MATPMPLTVYGPVTPLSPSVRVTGVLRDAVVTIFDDGKPIGHATAATFGELNVPFTKPPTVGHSISAVQKNSSGTSEPSVLTVQVVDIPDPLPTPAFASSLNTCMSDISADNLVPGATVITTIGGIVFGSGPAGAVIDWLNINPTQAIGLNSTARIQQQATVGGVVRVSPAIESLPIPQLHLTTHLLPPPVLGPLMQCDIGRNFYQVVEGASTVIENEGQSELWINSGPAYYGSNGLPLRKGKLVATQSLPRCDRKGQPANLTVQPAAIPPAPSISLVICPEVMQVVAFGLWPGGVLHLSRFVQYKGYSSTTSLGDHGIAYETEMISLPPDLQLTDPDGDVSIGFSQSRCGDASPATLVKGIQGGHSFGHGNIIGRLFACSRAIPVEKALGGAVIQPFDFDTGKPIGDAVSPFVSTLLVYTWFPLVANRRVFIRQTGCDSDGDSPFVKVEPLPNFLPAPTMVGPVRPGAPTITAKDIIPGARVYLFVNNELRSGPFVVYSSTVTIPVTGSPLGDQQVVFVVQNLCSLWSHRNDNGLVVHKGNMKVSVSPGTAIRGTLTNIHVTAMDADTKAELSAQVFLDGALKGLTGTPIAWLPVKGEPNPAGIVRNTPGYNDAAFTILLTDPKTKFKITFNAANVKMGFGTVPVTVTSIVWTASPDYGASMQSTTVLPSGVSASGSVNVNLPTAAVKTVSIAMSGVAHTPGGSYNGYTVDAQDFTFKADPRKIGYIGSDETIEWFFELVYATDPTKGGIFVVQATFAHIMP